jgi:Family of unknown function (DUF6496)
MASKYGKSSQKNVESAMRRRKKGTLKSGSGGKVTSRKQAIAIGLSEAREKGGKVPARKSSSKKSSKTKKANTSSKSSKSSKSSSKKSSAKKSSSKKSSKKK